MSRDESLSDNLSFVARFSMVSIVGGLVPRRYPSSIALLLVLGSATTCQPSERTAGDLIRSADPFERGYTDADYPRVRALADNVFFYEQIHPVGDETITTVSLFVVTSEGVLVADGQESPAETERLVGAIAEITNQPITHVVIGSDHGDHTGGNSAFPETAAFLAHPTSRVALEALAASPDRSADAPPVVLPTELVEEQKIVRLGGREIHVLFLGRAHTGGDLMVYLPQEKILFMSETFLPRIFPAMRSAYPTEWVAVIERAQAMDVETYIPGHGVVESLEILKDELETFKGALEFVIAEAIRLHHDAVSVDEAVAQARFGELERWTLRTSQGARSIRRVYLELDGGLR